jgi:predicted AAA+ superfamily ATPase
VGKTTLAKTLVKRWRGPTTFFDLEDSADRARLRDPMLALESLRGLIVLDEIQHAPDVFAPLRVLADRKRARYLLLGSASGDLLRQTSESLAGRVAFHELTPLGLDEVGTSASMRLWLRGGFPLAYLARTLTESMRWRRDFVRTFLERDIPQLGVRIPSDALGRFWSMLAHVHAQTLNWSELGRSMAVSDTTVRHYLDVLSATFMVRQLPPWYANIGKRQVKAPKVYVRDSGMLHALLGISGQDELERHPKVGASWEGFCLEALIRHLRAGPHEAFFWATHAGAELDLLIVRGAKKRGFEIKRTSSPELTPSMRIAMEDLELDSLDVIHAGRDTFPLTPKIRAVALRHLVRDITIRGAAIRTAQRRKN